MIYPLVLSAFNHRLLTIFMGHAQFVMPLQDLPTQFNTQTLRHKLDQLTQFSPRWQAAAVILITFGIAVWGAWYFRIISFELFATVLALVFIISYGLVALIRRQLHAWHRQATEVLLEVIRQENSISSHNTLLNGIDVITGATAELLAAESVDAMCRMAVEMARERLHVERCGIFLLDPSNPGFVRGTYGTNLHSQTTVEHHIAFEESYVASVLTKKRGIQDNWIYKSTVELHDEQRHLIGASWRIDTLISDSSNNPIGVFFNDKAISGGQPDRDQQILVASFCATLGTLIEQKRARERDAQSAQWMRAILETANELLQAQSEDELWRIAVEQARSRLGIDRCAIFRQDSDGRFAGTYGTDSKGNTTNERDYAIDNENLEHYNRRYQNRHWYVEADSNLTEYAPSSEVKAIGRGWVVHTPIFFSNGTVRAVMFNDTFISQKPIDDLQQNLLAVYCSILGDIVERKRLEASLQESNQKLEQRVERRTQQLAKRVALDRLVADVASQFIRLDPQSVETGVKYALARVGEFFKVHTCRVFLLDHGDYSLQVAYEWRMDGIDPDNIPYGAQSFYERYPWWHRKLLSDEMIRINTLDQFPPEMSAFVQTLRGRDVRSLVSAPLMREGNELIGELGFDVVGEERAWTDEDMTQLRIIADTVSGAIERARITQALQSERDLLDKRVTERTRELATLLDISQMLSATRDTTTLLKQSMTSLNQLVHFDRRIVWERISALEWRVSEIASDSAALADLEAEWVYDPGIDLHWQVILDSKRPLIVPNTYADTTQARAHIAQWRRYMNPQFRLGQLASAMYVPILAHGEVMGIVGLFSHNLNEYKQTHAELTLTLANQIGISIDNARLHKQQVKAAALSERNRLARELHDSVSQALFGIVLGARTLKHNLGSSRHEYAAEIEYLLKLSEVSLAEMRALIFELRPESIEKFGLIESFKKQATELCNRYGLALNLQTDDQDPALPLAVKEAIYRVGMEALQNAIKHAKAENIWVELRVTAQYQVAIQIRDDGVGFDALRDYEGHLGLQTMRERVAEYGGVLEIRSAPGQGSIIQAQFPLNIVKSAFQYSN